MGKYSDYIKKEACYYDECDSVFETLRKNIGRVVIVFTESCCKGISGLVAKVDKNTVKLVTSLPSAPTYPSWNKGWGCNNFSLCNHSCPSFFGSATIIPICSITSVVIAEI